MQGGFDSEPQEEMGTWEGTRLLLRLMVEMSGEGDSDRAPGLQPQESQVLSASAAVCPQRSPAAVAEHRSWPLWLRGLSLWPF